MIGEFVLISILKLKIFKNILKSFSFWKRISIPFVLGTILFVLIYYILFRFFNFMSKIPVLGIIVSQKFLDFTLMGTFFFLTLSNIVGSFSLFFEDDELPFLYKFPLKKESIFSFKFLEIIIYSSWVPLIFLIPLILSYLNVFKLKGINLFFLYLNFLLYILSSGLLGILLFYLFVKLSPFLKRELLPLFYGALFSIFIFLYFKFLKPESFKIFDAKSIDEAIQILKKAGTMSPYFLPSNWFFSSFILIKNNLLIFLLFLIFNSLLFILLISLPFDEIYHRKLTLKGGKGGRKSKLIFLQKELKSFYRNYTQLSQFLFLILLFVLYVISVRGKGIGIDYPTFHILIIFANFTFVIYLLITIAIRFIYPAPSLEEKGITIFYYSGQNLFKFFYFQLLLYFFLLIILGYTLFFLTHFSLKVRFFKDLTLLFIIILPLFVFILTFISLSTGYILPHFNEKNPTKIASGPGGFLTAISLILYLLVSIYILIQKPLHGFYYVLKSNFFFEILLLLILSFSLFMIFKIILDVKIKKMEF
ncbi:MAG: hypothetical protein ABIN23_00455 [candidate division WOR-3 bacterium]